MDSKKAKKLIIKKAVKEEGKKHESSESPAVEKAETAIEGGASLKKYKNLGK
ncbi:MAG: hypothetical protein WC069_05955 [Candidatus Shapirobacteria bacterium]